MAKRKRSHRLDVRLPADLSRKFITELLEALPDDGFKDRYLREELLSKYSDPTTTPARVRRERAITKWLNVERQNAITNQRLITEGVDFGWIHSDSFCEQVRSLVSRILGPVEYPSCVCEGYYTTGASTRIRRSPTAVFEKLAGEGELSSSAVKHWLAFASGTRLSDQCLRLNESSSLFTVPKSSEIDRVAAKEPEINQLLQRSVGLVIRQRLLRVGIDLRDQTRNQHLASIAVQTGLATVDLSSASDSITRQLAIRLLPFEWWSLLDDLRVKSTLIDGELHELEMFSSMGNGFTFELESLLFYAITRVVCWRSGLKGRISVYGDDIIVPSKAVPRLKRVMDFLGFKMNVKKTHYRGFFRESCGRHYYRGFDVSPFYIRREISTLPDLINHLNAVLEWDGRGLGFFSTESLARFHRKWSAFVPTRLHGGVETEDPSSLVTGDLPRHRLVPVTRKVRFPDDSAKLNSWFLTKRRTELPISTDAMFEVGYKTVPRSLAWGRTSWTPYLILGEEG